MKQKLYLPYDCFFISLIEILKWLPLYEHAKYYMCKTYNGIYILLVCSNINRLLVWENNGTISVIWKGEWIQKLLIIPDIYFCTDTSIWHCQYVFFLMRNDL